ncbi:MAG: exodeoxyribonuclease VII large subunit, partial [Gemmatimonadota bacterium]
PTPSAAAELAVPDRGELRARLDGFSGGLRSGLRRRTRLGSERARRLEDGLVRGVERRLERLAARLEAAGQRLDALSPLGTLRRGYAVPLGPDDRVLRRVEMFEEGEPFRLRVRDGTVHGTTERTEQDEEGA